MFFIKKWLLKKKKRKEYHRYIDNHKKNILRAFYELIQCKDLQWLILDPQILEPLWYRALEHDDSKYSEEEFEYYRRHYYPINAQEWDENEPDFKAAWEHHKKVNDHHWEHRQNWKDEDFDINTELACLENIMDWLAVGYKFKDRPYQYYEAHKNSIKLPKKQKDFIEKIIYEGIDKEYILKEKKRGLR